MTFSMGDLVTNAKGWTGVVHKVVPPGKSINKNPDELLVYVRWREREQSEDKRVAKTSVMAHRGLRLRREMG